MDSCGLFGFSVSMWFTPDEHEILIEYEISYLKVKPTFSKLTMSKWISLSVGKLYLQEVELRHYPAGSPLRQLKTCSLIGFHLCRGHDQPLRPRSTI